STMVRTFPVRLVATGLCFGVLCTVLPGQTPALPGQTSATLGQASTPIANGSVSSSITDPVQRFLTHPDEKLTQYRAKRHLQARNNRFDKEGWLDAMTELDPGQGFRYTVLAEDGSGIIRNRVLRKALEAEQEAFAQGEVARSAISTANYRIAFS